MNGIVDLRATILIECDKVWLVYCYISKETIINRIKERSQKEGRIDDSMETLERRISSFKNETMPVIEKLSEIASLIKLDGNNSNPEIIHKKLIRALRYLI